MKVCLIVCYLIKYNIISHFYKDNIWLWRVDAQRRYIIIFVIPRYALMRIIHMNHVLEVSRNVFYSSRRSRHKFKAKFRESCWHWSSPSCNRCAYATQKEFNFCSVINLSMSKQSLVNRVRGSHMRSNVNRRFEERANKCN